MVEMKRNADTLSHSVDLSGLALDWNTTAKLDGNNERIVMGSVMVSPFKSRV